jgi:hypothetical protein
MFYPLDIWAFVMILFFRFIWIRGFNVRNTMANTLPTILSKSSIRHDLIECLETCIRTSLLSAPEPQEQLIVDAMTEYISVRCFVYMHPVCLA